MEDGYAIIGNKVKLASLIHLSFLCVPARFFNWMQGSSCLKVNTHDDWSIKAKHHDCDIQ